MIGRVVETRNFRAIEILKDCGADFPLVKSLFCFSSRDEKNPTKLINWKESRRCFFRNKPSNLFELS